MRWIAALIAVVLAVLYFEDKTPKEAMLSFAREILKGLRLAHLPLHTLERWVRVRELKKFAPSPYKRTRDGVVHLPVILNLPTSEGSGEAAHPDALHAPDGWGAGRWTWLMSATPYPSGGDFFENPELFVSYDGIQWTEPASGVNPLSRVPVETGRRDLKKEYHSDASLLLHDGVLRVYYRWSGVALDGSVENRILVTSSSDGIQWGEPVTLLAENGAASRNSGFLSPSLLFMDGMYVMWMVERDGPGRKITRRVSEDGLVWQPPEDTVLDVDYAVKEPWHLDVIPCAETGGTILLLTAARDRGGEAELHYGFGGREGRSWRLAGRLIDPGYFFESGKIYRSSLVSVGDGAYILYYSACDIMTKWSIARVALRLGEDRRSLTHDF